MSIIQSANLSRCLLRNHAARQLTGIHKTIDTGVTTDDNDTLRKTSRSLQRSLSTSSSSQQLAMQVALLSPCICVNDQQPTEQAAHGPVIRIPIPSLFSGLFSTLRTQLTTSPWATITIALENVWDGFLLGVPKKRRSLQVRRQKMRARYPEHRQDIEVCPVCGDKKLENFLCQKCFDRVMQETEAVWQAQQNDKDQHRLPRKKEGDWGEDWRS